MPSKDRSIASGSLLLDILDSTRRLAGERFDPIAWLNHRFPPRELGGPRVRAIWIEPDELIDPSTLAIVVSKVRRSGGHRHRADVVLLHVLAEDPSEMAACRRTLRALAEPQLVVTLPKEPQPFERIISEMLALQRLKPRGEAISPLTLQASDSLQEELVRVRTEITQWSDPDRREWWYGGQSRLLDDVPRFFELALQALFPHAVQPTTDPFWIEPQQPDRRLAMHLLLNEPGPIVSARAEERAVCDKLTACGLLQQQEVDLYAPARVVMDGQFAGIWTVLADRLGMSKTGVRVLAGELLLEVLQGPPHGWPDETLEMVLAAFVAAWWHGLRLYSGRRRVRKTGDLDALSARPWNVRSVVRLLRNPSDHLVIWSPAEPFRDKVLERIVWGLDSRFVAPPGRAWPELACRVLIEWTGKHPLPAAPPDHADAEAFHRVAGAVLDALDPLWFWENTVPEMFGFDPRWFSWRFDGPSLAQRVIQGVMGAREAPRTVWVQQRLDDLEAARGNTQRLSETLVKVLGDLQVSRDVAETALMETLEQL